MKVLPEDGAEGASCISLYSLMLYDGQGQAAAPGCWNLDVVTEVLGSSMDPERLALELDHPEFTLPNPKAFLMLMALWRGATGGTEKPKQGFPLATLVQRSWSNVAGQLEFLKFATAAPPEVFSFEHAQRKASIEVPAFDPLLHHTWLPE